MKRAIEKALMEFLMDVRITGREREKGIPLVTFVYKEEDRAVLLKALPLPAADIQTKGKMLTGKELLYRVDFFKEGEAKVSIGVLPRIKEPAPFLTLLENAIKGCGRKAGYQSLLDHLRSHNALCSLEALAKGELSFMGQIPGKLLDTAGSKTGTEDRYAPANAAYYREVLSYVQTGRDILNACPPGIPLPSFPDRSVFMAKRYRENGQGSL